MGKRFNVVSVIFLGCVTFTLPTAATAEVLLIIDQSVEHRSTSPPPPSDFQLFIAVHAAGRGSTPRLAAIADGLMLNMSHVGQTFVFNSSNDPGFDEFAALITDGVDMRIRLTQSPSVGLLSDESCVIGRVCGGVSDVDFKGYAIDQITFTIKDWYEQESRFSGVLGNGVKVDTFYGHRLTIEGHAIPEPSTFALTAFAALGLLGNRRRWVKQRRGC